MRARANAALRRLLHPAYRTLETKVHPLRYLFVELTQRCNLECRHCGSDCGKEARPSELSTEEWLRFFGTLASSFDTRELMLVVTGGEPLCHPEIDRLIEGLHQHGLAFGMVTNGWLLDARRLRRLRSAGLVSLTISLDGLRASHDWLRGRSGSYEKALSAIRAVVESDLSLFDVVTCVGPRNLEELPDVLALLRREGVPAWRLFSIFPKGRAADDPDLLLTEEQHRRLFAFIAEARRARGERGPKVDFSCEGFLPGSVDRAVRDEPYFCRAGIAIGSVLSDGAISACPNVSRALVQGNVRTDDFREVWRERFAPFRERSWMAQGECAACADFGRCQGNSMHLWDDQSFRTVRCHATLFAPGDRR